MRCAINLLEGLLLFEIVLFALGTVLFCLLTGMLLYGKLPKGGIGFFLVAVIMIAYPSIQKLSFLNGLIELETYTKKVRASEGAEREEIAKTLRSRLADIQEQRIRTSETYSAIAEAQAAIGEHDKALKNVDKALTLRPDLSKAIALKKKLQEAPHQ